MSKEPNFDGTIYASNLDRGSYLDRMLAGLGAFDNEGLVPQTPADYFGKCLRSPVIGRNQDEQAFT